MPKTKKGSKMSIGRGSPHVHNTANKDTTWQHVSGTDCFDYDYKVQSNYYIEVSALSKLHTALIFII